MTLFALSRLTLICCSDMRASVLHRDQFSYLSPDSKSQKDRRRCFQPGLKESNGGEKNPKRHCFCFVKPSLWSVSASLKYLVHLSLLRTLCRLHSKECWGCTSSSWTINYLSKSVETHVRCFPLTVN